MSEDNTICLHIFYSFIFFYSGPSSINPLTNKVVYSASVLFYILLFLLQHVPDDLSISADSAHPSVNHPLWYFSVLQVNNTFEHTHISESTY